MSRTIVIERHKPHVRDWIHAHKTAAAFLFGLVFAVVIVASIKVTEAVALQALAERAAVAAQRSAAVPDVELPPEWRWQHRPVDIGPMVRGDASRSAGSMSFVMDRNRGLD